jgi:isopentenyl-diphosphate Delta-isomerase
MQKEEVILVDEADHACGTMEKMEAHRTGRLHRAFSIFIFNSNDEMMLQKRAQKKYHSGGLWTNACCSHPRPGETIESAAERRLQEEMGFKTGLNKIFDFIYKAELDHELTEHEFDHVFAGVYDGPVHIDRDEVEMVCFKSFEQLSRDLQEKPESFTIWFRLAFPRVKAWKEGN